MEQEQALSLKDAAKLLNVAYGTVFAKRHAIGFRLPGSRIWRVWPSQLAELTKPSNNRSRLSLRVVGENVWLSSNTLSPVSGGSISGHQTAKELDALLAQKTGKRRKNSTTG